MLYFGRLKTALILGVCVLGALLCLPNVLPAPASWLPWRQVHLGLDLRGGSYLLLQVDMDAVRKERLESIVDSARQALSGKYRSLAQQGGDRVVVALRDPAQAQAATDTLRTLATSGSAGQTAEFDIAPQPDGTLALTLNDAALRTRASNAVQQSIEIVRRRIDSTGVLDPQITRQGDSRIVVQLPGIDDPNRIKALLGTTAKMTFQLVDESADPSRPAPPGDVILPTDSNPDVKVVVRRRVEVDGASLKDASAGQNSQTGEWVINFVFDSNGTRRFADISTAQVGHRFAIVLDNKVLTDPVIREPITGGRGQISGSYTAQTATDLATLLRAGALPAPLTVVEERTVGPELGADSIRAGAIALGAGFLLVVAFMAIFYGLFGWFANIALLVNLILMLAILSLLEATLTLPGMAGILLTLGMAVDANILINERIREETRNDRKPVAAMENGFRRAYSTIIDSNVTALLAHVMLFVFGTGPVRGFAVTITVGIVTTLFTATVVARLLMVRWYARNRPALLPV
jgi:protein-export membrane protein SecD